MAPAVGAARVLSSVWGNPEVSGPWTGCSLEGHSAWLEGQSGHQCVLREMSAGQRGGQVTSTAAGPG